MERSPRLQYLFSEFSRYTTFGQNTHKSALGLRSLHERRLLFGGANQHHTSVTEGVELKRGVRLRKRVGREATGDKVEVFAVKFQCTHSGERVNHLQGHQNVPSTVLMPTASTSSVKCHIQESHQRRCEEIDKLFRRFGSGGYGHLSRRGQGVDDVKVRDIGENYRFVCKHNISA